MDIAIRTHLNGCKFIFLNDVKLEERKGAEMSGESKDPAIKLFGKTIPLSDESNGVGTGKGREGRDPERDHEEFEDDDDDDDVSGNDEVRETSSDPKASSYTQREEESRLVNSTEASSSDTTTGVSSKNDEEQSTSDPREKVLKKPDKILPCPRCNSMETKFCYYNNYNVNQPRHFCKNCQRYWTAGGTMRNVPVGAGRRKSKSAAPASNCRHITVPEGLQIPNGFHHPPQLKTNGTVLAFGSTDSRLCESMASVLNIGEKSPRSCTQNGFHQPGELIIPVACRKEQNGADIVNGAQAGDSLPNHERENAVSKDCALQNLLGIPQQMPCFPGTPWPYPVSPPAFVPQVIPMPFYLTAAYWSIPWIPQPPPPPTVATSSHNSPSLGKHSRDEITGKLENLGKEESSTEDSAEKCLWIPKTLRIDDPKEAAKSSIWATLGIENNKADPMRGPCKAFQPNIEARRVVAETSAFLQANPAALSRSINFHENA